MGCLGAGIGETAMKIALIHGQNHKGSTYHMGRLLAERLAKEDPIREFFLPRDLPRFCCGCAQCILKSETLCPHANELAPITKAMDEADVLIFTTPVYVYHATGSMKAFLDHYGYRWMVHRPEEAMFHKQAVCLSTAAGAGMKSANRDIRDSLFYWGVPKVYCYGIAVRATSWQGVSPKKRERIDRAVRKLAKQVEGRQGKIRVPLKTRGYFAVMRKLVSGCWNPADQVYWRERGWDKDKRPWKAD